MSQRSVEQRFDIGIERQRVVRRLRERGGNHSEEVDYESAEHKLLRAEKAYACEYRREYQEYPRELHGDEVTKYTRQIAPD